MAPQALEDFTLRWSLYNAIDEKCAEDDTCDLVWDPDSQEAYFVFDDEGIVADHLKELNLL